MNEIQLYMDLDGFRPIDSTFDLGLSVLNGLGLYLFCMSGCNGICLFKICAICKWICGNVEEPMTLKQKS